MQIEVNEKNEIQFYALTGSLNNGIEIEESILPEGFTAPNFKRGFYLYVGGSIVDNPNYEEPETEKGPVTPNADEALATLMLQVAQNKADQDKFNAQLLLQTATAQAEGK